jgi:mRNA interferase RelE/StbE
LKRKLAYKVKWHPAAIDDLLDLEQDLQKKIADKIKNYLSIEPLSLGKPLKGIFKGLYRYRYGDYRIIYSIDRTTEHLIVLRIGHRKDVYEK